MMIMNQELLGQYMFISLVRIDRRVDFFAGVRGLRVVIFQQSYLMFITPLLWLSPQSG